MVIPAGYTIRFPKEGGPPGDHGSIAIKDRDWRAFKDDANPRGQAQAIAVMRTWCGRGPRRLLETRFRFELHFRKGGKSVRVDAFKGHQVRFYGTTIDVEGKPMFLVTGCDFAKKQDKFNERIVNAAGEAALKLLQMLKDR